MIKTPDIEEKFFHMRENKIKIKLKITNRNGTHYAVLFGKDFIENENSLQN